MTENKALSLASSKEYDQKFFDDLVELFMGLNSGHVGKYIYDAKNWGKIITHSKDYYVPTGDDELLAQAGQEIKELVPQGTPYIDLGVGGSESIKRHALPIIRELHSESYTGVDFCEPLLREAKSLESVLGIPVGTVQTDFFKSSAPTISETPALGVMNGLTLANMYGTLRDVNNDLNLTTSLKTLSRMCGRGWLLLTIDTNQDQKSLTQAYDTPLTSQLYLGVLSRAARDLPIRGFNPLLFTYKPVFNRELQLLAHTAVASESQDFDLGKYHFHIKKGQEVHLLNSYKYSQSFFESCCLKAELAPIKQWKHKSGMMLYLLRDSELLQRIL